MHCPSCPRRQRRQIFAPIHRAATCVSMQHAWCPNVHSVVRPRTVSVQMYEGAAHISAAQQGGRYAVLRTRRINARPCQGNARPYQSSTRMCAQHIQEADKLRAAQGVSMPGRVHVSAQPYRSSTRICAQNSREANALCSTQDISLPDCARQTPVSTKWFHQQCEGRERIRANSGFLYQLKWLCAYATKAQIR